jgi:hypothetical protein
MSSKIYRCVEPEHSNWDIELICQCDIKRSSGTIAIRIINHDRLGRWSREGILSYTKTFVSGFEDILINVLVAWMEMGFVEGRFTGCTTRQQTTEEVDLRWPDKQNHFYFLTSDRSVRRCDVGHCPFS